MSKISEIFSPACFASCLLAFLPMSFKDQGTPCKGSDHNLYGVNELGDGISYLFHNDFMAICGESFVITSSICVLIYGVISNRPRQGPLSPVGAETLYTQEIAKANLLQEQNSTKEHSYTNTSRKPPAPTPAPTRGAGGGIQARSAGRCAARFAAPGPGPGKLVSGVEDTVNVYIKSSALDAPRDDTPMWNLIGSPSFLRYRHLQGQVSTKGRDFACESTFTSANFESREKSRTNPSPCTGNTSKPGPGPGAANRAAHRPADRACKRGGAFLKERVSFESAPILVRNCGVHALLILFFAILLLINNPLYGEVFYNSLVIDYFTRFMQICICLASLFSICISLQYLQKINTYELVVLILLAVASMLLLASASDLICVYAAIEFQSLCFYVLAGLKRNSESSTEAGLKYLLLGAFSSGILLFGCSLLYTFTGTSSFFEYAHLLSNSEYNNSEYLTSLGTSQLSQEQSLEQSFSDPSILPLRACQLGFTFLLVGLLFKCAAAPFHMWVPDVYEGAPTAITAFFSIVPKLSLFAVLIRLLSLGTFEGCVAIKSQDAHSFLENGSKSLDFFDQTNYNSLILHASSASVDTDTKDLLLYGGGPYSVLLFSCIASLLIGTFSAISQNKIKRLLAYSSIGHVGFLLIGCTLHSGEGLVAVLVYLLIYIAMTIPMFAYMLSPLARERYVQLSGFR